MARTSDPTAARREAASELDVNLMARDYRQLVQERETSYWHRMRENYKTRMCVWPHQTWDGRKWGSSKNENPWPWKGASDARVGLVDKYIREDAAVLMEAWRRAHITVRPNRPGRDAAMGANLTLLLQWLIETKMDEIEDEAEQAAEMMLERGAVAVGVYWWREEANVRETVTLQALANVRPAGPTGPSIADLIADPTQDAAVVDLISQFLGQLNTDDHGWTASMTKARLAKLVRQLREQGEADFPKTVIKNDRPSVVTLVLNEDLWLPAESTDLRWTRKCFRRELVTEAELEMRAHTLGWNQDWVDWMIETQRGRVTLPPGQYTYDPLRLQGREWFDTRYLYEVVQGYERRYDEDGIPGIYVTTFSPMQGAPPPRGKKAATPDAAEWFASQELLPYDHGQFPFTLITRERRTRKPDESRGVGETLGTLQNSIKRQWDGRSDRADLTLTPPSFHPPDERPAAWGPGVEIPTMQPNAFGWLEGPRPDAGSKEFELTVREFADEYMGRLAAGGRNKEEAGALRAHLLGRWLSPWKRRIYPQILQLEQQYGPDDIYALVTGGQQPTPLHISRAAIQGEFNLQIVFTPRQQDPEQLEQMTGLFERWLQLDTTGIVDRQAVMRVLGDMIQPGMASLILKPGEAASAKEIDDELATYSGILSGVDKDVRPGQAYQLRLQTLQTAHANNPTGQLIAQHNPQVQKLLQKRFQQLQFNIQQVHGGQNAMIGRMLGSKPAATTPGAVAPDTQAPPVPPGQA